VKTTRLDLRGTIERIDELLEASYRSADLGNLEDPLSETIYILLSKQTREAVYCRVFAHLRRDFPRWIDVLRAPPSKLGRILKPAGFQRQRTRQLKALLAAVQLENETRRIGPAPRGSADLTLDFLRKLSDVEAESFLRSLPGIGPKSARCVMAYALHRPAFAVDTHVHRIFVRLGLVESAGRKADHDPFQAAVPARMRKRLHVNLVHHGRTVCRTQRARCGDCVLISFCPHGRKTSNARKEPVAVDLFAGAGGLGYGFRKSGFRVALAVEADRHAAQTYRLNNAGVPVIEALLGKSTRRESLLQYMPGVKRIDTLLAGPPCQGYSAAGSRNPQDPMNKLYRCVARVATQLNAGSICLENVPGVQRVNGQSFFRSIISSLGRAGYSVAPHLLRSCEYGVPQHRLRYFFLCRRGQRRAKIPAPAPTHRSHGSSDHLELPETPRLLDLLCALPRFPNGASAERFVDGDSEVHFNMSTMAHCSSVIRKIRAIKSGEGPISYRRLEADEARTLIAGHRAFPVHPILDRTISVREAALIQGFPNDYFFCGPRAWQPLQVANAVPPPLAEAVAAEMLKCMTSARRRSRK
jgi:DNA (cytosine-5)-methyltransferase 1